MRAVPAPAIEVTAAERQSVDAALRRRDLAPRVREPLEMVKAAALGHDLAAVAVAGSGRSAATVRRWLAAFRGGGQDRLGASRHRLGEHAGQKGGETTWAEPDRPPPAGHEAAPDRRGPRRAPAVVQSAANAHDATLLEKLVDAVPPIERSSGQRCKRPGKAHADKGYDFPRCRGAAPAAQRSPHRPPPLGR